MRKQIFISNIFGYANKGDWALLNSLINLLIKTYGNQTVLYGVCKNPVEQKKMIPNVIWIKQFGSSERKGLHRKIEIILGYILGLISYLTYDIFTFNEFTKKLKKSDFIIACPGGYLHDANHSLATNLINLLVCSKNRRAKFIFAPQSIGPIRYKFYKKTLKFILKKADHVMVREQYSKEFVLEELKIDKTKVESFLDVAFYDSTVKSFELEKYSNNSFFSTTLIKWLYPNMSNCNDRYKQYLILLCKFYNKIIETYNKDLIVLKQIENYGEDIGDDQIFYDLKKLNLLSNRVKFVEKILDPYQMKFIISRSHGFIGSRMHSNIFALEKGIPLLAISYQPKTEFIMKSLGLQDFFVDINYLDFDVMLKKFDQALSNRAKFKEVEKQIQETSDVDTNRFISILKNE